MVKKKSRTLAFILAASLIMPTVESTVLAANNEESGVVQEVSNEATNTENSNSTETPESKPIFASGDGTLATPYIINSLEQLKAFRDSVNAGNTYAGKYIKLTASVDLSGENWEPIGRGNTPFKGNFDGGSKEGIVVSNIKIEKELDNKARNSYVGLFGHLVSPGKIENLSINNATIKGGLYVSPAVGMGFTGTISNVNVTGDIKVDGYWYIGGILGNGYASISDCKVIASKGSYINGTGSYIGGITGFRGEGANNTVNCQVQNLKITGIDRLGGISGIIHYGNTISNCTVKDTIIKSDKYDDNADTVGTIAGANLAGVDIVKILDCSVENTFAYLYNSDKPLTQKVSMLNNEGKEVTSKVIVGNGVNFENEKVVSGKFEALTSDMYDSNTLKPGGIGNGQFILVEKAVMAMIGDTKYNSFEEALEKVEPNQTINVVGDLTIDKPLDLEGKKGITIDFNGNNVNTGENFAGESVILLKNSDDTSIENVKINITKGAKNAIKVKSSQNALIKDVEIKNSNNDKGAGVSIESNSNVNLSGKISSDEGTAVSVNNSNVSVKDSLNVEGQGKVEIDKDSKLEINENADMNLSVDLTNNGKIENNGTLENTGKIENNGTLENTGNLDLGENVQGNIPEVEDKVFEAKVTTNTITIKAIEGIKAEYKIEKDNSKSIKAKEEWKTPDANGLVTFTNLNSGTNYKILVRYKDVQDAKIKEVLKVKTEEVYYPGGGTGGGSSKPEKPVYTHEEIIGADRYDTAAKIADRLDAYDNVVLVNATSTMSDGLSASGLAGKENGAILLTKKDSIPKATMDRIKKVKKVYIIGGEAAISAKVANEITAAGIKVERLGGKDRVETSKLVAEKLGNYKEAFVVNGFKGEADAMSASAAAAKNGAPILLTNGKTSNHDKKSGVEYYVIGGNSVVDKSIVDKYEAEVLAGKDRYETNREVIAEFYSNSDKLYLANGDTLVDALTASPLAKNEGIVLVNKKSDNSILKDKHTVQVGGMNFEIEFEK